MTTVKRCNEYVVTVETDSCGKKKDFGPLEEEMKRVFDWMRSELQSHAIRDARFGLAMGFFAATVAMFILMMISITGTDYENCVVALGAIKTDDSGPYLSVTDCFGAWIPVKARFSYSIDIESTDVQFFKVNDSVVVRKISNAELVIEFAATTVNAMPPLSILIPIVICFGLSVSIASVAVMRTIHISVIAKTWQQVATEIVRDAINPPDVDDDDDDDD